MGVRTFTPREDLPWWPTLVAFVIYVAAGLALLRACNSQRPPVCIDGVTADHR